MTLTKALGSTSGGSGSLTVKDEGSTLSSAVASIDVVGGSVIATGTTAVTLKVLAPLTPDTEPSTINVADDEWNGGSLDTGGTRTSGATAWAWDNQGSATATLTRGRLVLSCVGDGSGSYKTHNIFQSLPAGDWTYEMEYRLFGLTGSFSAAGPMIRESGTDKRLSITKGIDTSSKLQVRRLTNATTWTANPYNSTTDEALNWQQFYAKIARSGTTITISLGDGAYYLSRYSFTQTTEFTTAPDQIGLSVGPSNSEVVVLSSGWFRRTA